MSFYSLTPAQDTNLKKEARKEEERRLFVPLGKLRLLTAENKPFYTRSRKGKLEMSWWGKEVVRSPVALVWVCLHYCQGSAAVAPAHWSCLASPYAWPGKWVWRLCSQGQGEAS